MKGQPDWFREYGVIPQDASPPTGVVRAYFSLGQVVGQYLGTLLMSGLGIGLAVGFGASQPFPVSVAAAAAPLALFGGIVYVATRNDFAWVELDGKTLRAKHLYTRRVYERTIDQIDDLLTLVCRARTALEVRIAEAWIGRIRGIEIRFRDKRRPFRINRADPAMKNAKELIQAVIWRMSELGEVAAEIIDLEGKPLVRRIHWQSANLALSE